MINFPSDTLAHKIARNTYFFIGTLLPKVCHKKTRKFLCYLAIIEQERLFSRLERS